ncbi:MAG: ABC transporter substrate-binding protein [Myxococcales bacterium]
MPPGIAQARNVVLAVQQSVTDVAALGSDLGYEERRAVLMDVGLKYFDLPLMGELSFGPGYGELSAEQQQLWIDTFILFRSSASAKVNSRDRRQVYRLMGYETISDRMVLIRTSVKYPLYALEISVDYRLMRSGGQWKIVDRYSPSSVSEIAMRRSEYRTVLEKEGFDGLILDMDRRIKGYMSN